MTNQLRIRVAEAMGWKMKCERAIAEGWPDHERWIIHPDGWVVKREELPAYDTDANLALLLVARLKEQGWEYRLCSMGEGHFCEFFKGDQTTETGRSMAEHAETPSLAICLAFIKATQGETKL